MADIVNLLDVYTFEEILAFNDLTIEELLEQLVEMKYIKLPEVEPLE